MRASRSSACSKCASLELEIWKIMYKIEIYISCANPGCKAQAAISASSTTEFALAVEHVACSRSISIRFTPCPGFSSSLLLLRGRFCPVERARWRSVSSFKGLEKLAKFHWIICVQKPLRQNRIHVHVHWPLIGLVQKRIRWHLDLPFHCWSLRSLRF